MKLYHGSTVAVRNPNLRKGRSNADFGKGFYTTSNLEQAKRWANIKKGREEADRGIVSVYEFDESLLNNPEWNICHFDGVDETWLYFVTDCRKSREHDFDLVLGPVANDKVFTTVNLFESGALSAEAAILELKAYKTYDQISFHTGKTLKTLRYVESFEV
jgi:hypothetical protein